MPWYSQCKRTEKMYPVSGEEFQLVKGGIYQLRKISEIAMEIIHPYTGETMNLLRDEGHVFFEKPYWEPEK